MEVVRAVNWMGLFGGIWCRLLEALVNNGVTLGFDVGEIYQLWNTVGLVLSDVVFMWMVGGEVLWLWIGSEGFQCRILHQVF